MAKALFSLILAAACQFAMAETLTGRVVAVADGDMLTILDASNQQHRIRVAGIDAPEKKQAFGQRSKMSLGDLAFGLPATADCRESDRYGRSVCVVTVQGRDVGLEQVRNGLAWWYRKYSKTQTPQERAEYEAGEDYAKGRRLGLWADPVPAPPWDWRKARKSGG